MNDYAKTLKKPKKAVEQLKSIKKACPTGAIIIVVRPILMTWPVHLIFPADLPFVVFLSEDAVYDLLDEHFQMGVELLEIATKMIKERWTHLYFIFPRWFADAKELLRVP